MKKSISNKHAKLINELLALHNKMSKEDLSETDCEQLHKDKEKLIKRIRESELFNLLDEARLNGIWDESLEIWIKQINQAYKFLDYLEDEYREVNMFYFIKSLVIKEHRRIEEQIQRNQSPKNE